MKHFYINFLILLLFFNASLKSQNWKPFPDFQKSYFLFNEYGIDSAIEMICQDSSTINGIQTTLYFRTKTVNYSAENCREQIYPFYLAQINHSFSLDSLQNNGDTIGSATGPGIYFLPMASSGQSWISYPPNPTTFYCDSVTTGIIFNQTDSIKYFHTTGANGGQHLALSKNHGFINFFHWWENSNIVHTFQLIGFKDSTGNYGFQKPEFTDFLPYHPGDILKWRFDYLVHFGPGTYTEYYHDSITQVSTFSDSLVYTFDRTKISSNSAISFTPNLTARFTCFHYASFLRTEINDVGVSWSDEHNSDASLYESSYLNIRHDSVQSSNYYEREFVWNNNTIDSLCHVTTIVDGVSDFYRFNTHQGLTYIRYGGWVLEIIYSLEGARIGNYTYGNPFLNVGVEDAIANHLTIFPNPVKDYLEIKNLKYTFDQITISDITARKIKTYSFADNSIYDVQQLSPGLYLLTFSAENKIFTLKFIKY